ncbi:MAG: hypothetical protein ABIP39_08455 [Polyangiaceae bacterium]
MDPKTHKRFLDYREKFTYFGRGEMVQLNAVDFTAADAEYRELVAKGDGRDDEEEARYEYLLQILLLD